MVGQSKLRLCLSALVPEPSSDMIHMSDLTPSKCFRKIAVSLAIDPNKVPCLFSVVEYEGHHHPLYFMDKPSPELDECNAYDSYCKRRAVSDEFRKTKSLIFQCKDCDFNVHLLCGPLPPAVKYELHRHPLTLDDSFVEDGSGDYCCDACEEKRDPRICVYRCEECRFVAHVQCMISEVSRVLNGDYDDVNLRIANIHRALSTFQNENKSGESLLTFRKLIRSLKDEEQRSFAQHFEEDISKSTLAFKPSKLEDSFYSDAFHNYEEEESQDVDRRDFRRIATRIKRFFEQERLQLNSKNLDVPTVKIKDYMVPWALGPVLEMLIEHRVEEQVRPSPRDFQKLTPEMKSLSFGFLCQVINSMHNIRVRDVSEELLRDWYCHALFLKSLGFRIGFLFDRLKQVTLAHFGLQVSRFESETPKTLTQEIAEGKQEITQLEERMTKLREKIVMQEAELERYRSTRKSNFTKKCLKEASTLEWKISGDDLFKI